MKRFTLAKYIMLSAANIETNKARIWFFRDKSIGYPAMARREKEERGGADTFMRGHLPRYYHQQNEREGTVIEVKRDSRPFTSYEIATMKLVERTPRATDNGSAGVYTVSRSYAVIPRSSW